MALDNSFVVKRGLVVNGPSQLSDNLSVSGSLGLYNDTIRSQWRDELDVYSISGTDSQIQDYWILSNEVFLSKNQFDDISGSFLQSESDPLFAAMSGQFILKDVSGMALTELMVFSATVGNGVDADYTSITDALNYFQASFFSYAIIDIVGAVSLSGNSIAITKPVIFQGRYNEIEGQEANFSFDAGQLQVNNLSIEFKDINLTSNGNENIILGNDSVDKVSNLYIRNSKITLSDYNFIKVKKGINSTHKIIVDNSSILYASGTPSAYFLQISGNPTVSSTTDLVFTNTTCNSTYASIVDSHSSNPTNVYCFDNSSISGSVNQSNGVVNVYTDASSYINATTKTLIDSGSRVSFTPNGTNGLTSVNVTNAINELGNTVSNLGASLSGSYIQKHPSSSNNIIIPTSASIVPLTISGAPSQTANLIEWKNYSGTVIASLAADGAFQTSTTCGNCRLAGVGFDAFGAVYTSGTLKLGSSTSTTIQIRSATSSVAFGDVTNTEIGSTFNPTSGTATYSNLLVYSTINQTGGASGITRSLYVSPVVTAAADHRAIETSYGNVQFNTGGASVKGFIVKGAAAQTANLQEWQNSSGTILASISANGGYNVYNTYTDANNYERGEIEWIGNQFTIETENAGTGQPRGILVKGAGTTITPISGSSVVLTISAGPNQTANLTEWKNSSGTVLASISADGSITLANLSGINGNIVIHDANGKLLDSGLLASSLSNGVVTLYPDSSTRNVIVPTSSSIIPITISGAANQTANLTEWKNNTGTILACIDASGGFSSLGSQYVNINTIATSGTNTIGTATDYLMVFTGVSAQTYTLPSCTNGRNIIVKNKSTGIITISGNATIDDGSSWVLYGGDAVTLIGNNTTNWEVV